MRPEPLVARSANESSQGRKNGMGSPLYRYMNDTSSDTAPFVTKEVRAALDMTAEGIAVVGRRFTGGVGCRC